MTQPTPPPMTGAEYMSQMTAQLIRKGMTEKQARAFAFHAAKRSTRARRSRARKAEQA